jgi:8-oxo-dGTP pyrophosphatase MutT (NUDIX family)
VIEPGESVLDGLEREVLEETGLVVASWAQRSYTVVVEAPDMGWQLRVEAWEAQSVLGDIATNDPDGIVEDARYVPDGDAPGLLAASPPWVHVPLGDWLGGAVQEAYRFALRGTQRRAEAVERLQ